MSVSGFTESVVEEAALEWLESLGYAIRNGPAIASGELGAERADYAQAVLEDRLRQALARLNPALPSEAIEDAFRKLTRADVASLVERTARCTGCSMNYNDHAPPHFHARYGGDQPSSRTRRCKCWAGASRPGSWAW